MIKSNKNFKNKSAFIYFIWNLKNFCLMCSHALLLGARM